jgi:hypothetical protein
MMVLMFAFWIANDEEGEERGKKGGGGGSQGTEINKRQCATFLGQPGKA